MATYQPLLCAATYFVSGLSYVKQIERALNGRGRDTAFRMSFFERNKNLLRFGGQRLKAIIWPFVNFHS